MTIQLPTTENVEQMRRAVYAALRQAGRADLASEAVAVGNDARDVQEYTQEVLKLSDELRFEWGGT